MKTELTINTLKAIALASSTEETRYYLCGVLFERYQNDSIRLVATDGHRMHMADRGAHEITDDLAPIHNGIVSTGDIKKLDAMIKLDAKAKSVKINGYDLELKIEFLGTDFKLIAYKGEIEIASIIGKFIDGTFPDYRRIIPREEGLRAGGNIACYRAAYLADFGKAAKLLGSNTEAIIIVNNKADGPARIVLNNNEEDFLGILLPMLHSYVLPVAKN